MEIKNEEWKFNFSNAMQSYALNLVTEIDNELSFHERVDYEDKRWRVTFGVFGR